MQRIQTPARRIHSLTNLNRYLIIWLPDHLFNTEYLFTINRLSFGTVKHHRKRLQLDAVRIELQTASQNFALHSSSSFVRNGIHQHRQMVTEYNPNYDFVAAKYPEQQLNELNRNRLELVRYVVRKKFLLVC